MDPLEMTPAELLGLRESLGLTLRAFSAAIGVDPSTVFAWEADPKRVSKPQRISKANARAVRALMEYTDQVVADLVAAHRPGERIVVYRTDEAYRKAKPPRVLSAAWHRQVAKRVSEQTGARIDYEA